MKRAVVIVVATLFIVALLCYTVTYTVRFTEAGVLTTFGKADPRPEDEGGSVKTRPGLYFKWPSPIQSVTKYDTRLRFLQARSQTQQTADARQIIVEAYCTWRVSNPLKFFQKFSNAGDRAEEHFRKADDNIQSLLRSAIGATSRFAMRDLFTPDKAGTKLPDLERSIKAALTAKDSDGTSLDSFGLEIADVGISRIMLPEDTTKEVFKRMGANRDKVAKEIEVQGEAASSTIRAVARNNAGIILSFAQNRASEIRTEGEQEATQYLKGMDANPELAVFLKSMEFFKSALAKRTTLVFSSSTPGFGLFNPDAGNHFKAGEIPSTGIDGSLPSRLAEPTPKPKAAPEPAPKTPVKGSGT